MHAPRVFLLTIAVVLVIWLAYLLSAALLAVGGQIPGLSVETASAATPLSCGTPTCGPATPQDYEDTAPTNAWAVVGVRSSTGAGNANVCLYRDAALTQMMACSNLAANTAVDFVAVDYHHTPGGIDYVRAQRASGTGDLCTSFDCGATVLAANATPINATWPANLVARSYNLVVGAGTYRVGVAITSGTADLGIAVFNSGGQANYAAGRSAAVAEADAHGGGTTGGEGLYFTSTGSDTVGLVIWSNTAAGTANYQLQFRTVKVLTANTVSNESGTAAADFLYIPTEPRGWSVVALRPGVANPTPDSDIKVYKRPDYIDQLARSSAEPGIVDFIVANYANAPEDTAAVLMVSLGPLGGYKLDWMYGPPVLASAEPTALNVGSRVGLGWKMNLVAGIPYLWKFQPTANTRGDASLGLYGPRVTEPQFTYGTRADSVAGSDAWGESPTGWVADQGVETFAYTPQVSGEFLLYLYQKGTQNVTGSLIYFPASLLDVPPPGAGRAAFVAPWPSPSRTGQSVRFTFDMPAAGAARLVLLDARGRAVRTLVHGPLGAGPAALAWDGRLATGAESAPGLYFARLERPGVRTEVRRFVRLN